MLLRQEGLGGRLALRDLNIDVECAAGGAAWFVPSVVIMVGEY